MKKNQEKGSKPLFNGKDFDDWVLLLRDGTPEEIKKVYTIDEGGILHYFRDLSEGSGSETRINAFHVVTLMNVVQVSCRGPKLQHNLLLTHCADIAVKDSRLDTSPYGSGLALDHCSDVTTNNREVARNAYYGILIFESHDITISGNLIEDNDRSGIMAEFLFKGSDEITFINNLVQYNCGYGVESYGATNIKAANNNYSGNGNIKIQQKLSDEKILLMQ